MGLSPFQVKIRVFMPGMTQSGFKLAKGQRLFTLSDAGLSECPHTGPQEVLVLVEDFGCWPVAVFVVSERDAKAWRKTSPADHVRMMKRIRRGLCPRVAA